MALPPEKKRQIGELLDKGVSIREIAKTMQVSPTTVQKIKKKREKTGDMINMAKMKTTEQPWEENKESVTEEIAEDPEEEVVEIEEVEEIEEIEDVEEVEEGTPIEDVEALLPKFEPKMDGYEYEEPLEEEVKPTPEPEPEPKPKKGKKKALIVYYSETGITKTAAEKISKVIQPKFDSRMCDIQIVGKRYGFIGNVIGSLIANINSLPIIGSIDFITDSITSIVSGIPIVGTPVDAALNYKIKARTFDCSPYNLIIVGTPVWCLNPAMPVLTWLENCRGIKRKPVAIFATCWMHPGMTIKKMKGILKRKGARVVSSVVIDTLSTTLGKRELNMAREFGLTTEEILEKRKKVRKKS